MRNELRYAVRLLARNPLFALTAALSLAIGIGADTTVFTIADALLFAPPAGVQEPGRVVDIGSTQNGRGGWGQLSYPNYLDIRQRATTLDGVYAYHPVPQPMSLAASGGAQTIRGTFVSTNYFSVLGVRPARGRLFDARDSDAAAAAPVVVLSHRFWTRQFNADEAIVGRTLTIGDHPLTVVGIAAEGFRGTSILAPDAWLPIGMGPSPLLQGRDLMFPLAGARLKPGVTVAAAAAEVDAIGRALEREYPDANRGRRLRLVPATAIPANILPVAAFLWLLMGVVSLVLITACANVAGLLLARAASRSREIAVRLALGAGRWRLIRQLLTETLMLFLLGGVAGVAIARVMTTLLVKTLPALPLPVDVSLPLDWRIVVFSTALSLGAAMLAGIAPALHASRADVMSTLKDESQGPSDRLRLRRAFVVAQVAISVLLVVGAALFVRALDAAGGIQLGFDPEGVEVTSLDLSLGGYSAADARTFRHDLVERASSLPGVQRAVMASTSEPIGDGVRGTLVRVPGLQRPDGRTSLTANWSAVDPGYFATLGIPLVAGRDFAAADRAGAPTVAIVGEAAARQFFPDSDARDALGRTIVLQMGRMDMATRDPGRVDRGRGDADLAVAVVGVARDIKYMGARDTRERPFVYIPLDQQPFGARMTLITRASGNRRVAGAIRALIASMNPALPIVSSQPLTDWLAVGLIPQRIAASVSGTLGVVGLLLAAMGIYGVTAYIVARRTREIGVRVALGATRQDVVRLILGHGVWLAAVGCAVGLALAVAVGRLLASFLLGVSALDPLAFTAAVATCTLVGLAASYVPVRRALDIDPIEALRSE